MTTMTTYTMSGGPRAEIGLAAATYLGLGLAALRDNDPVRAVEAFASIEAASWAAILDRFPNLPTLLRMGADR